VPWGCPCAFLNARFHAAANAPGTATHPCAALQEGGAPRFYERVNERWEVVVSLSDGQFQQVSFVNSICTSKGGTHVNAVESQVTKSLLELLAKKHKQASCLSY
jgi:DNA gyrase/topoisomerase IV subunit B